ncbi:hypothetical protein QYM36_007541 [Artemia franciscana]|uniref:Uncharacterized protein n=1 Tax=Artemia franciscana TaxID=6661 RepID=A0AA88IU26_ARTSF|nr:hypothetical protein QYM36_007541 [Artemia franciscana]
MEKSLSGLYYIQSKSAIAAFLRKLQLYKNNIRRRAFEQFPYLACVSSDLQDEDLALHGEYLENIHEDMQARFSDLLGIYGFSSTLLLFLSYLVEAGFSRVSQMLSKARNRLDIVKRGDLRLSLTSIEPNIKKLVEKHQPQGSR